MSLFGRSEEENLPLIGGAVEKVSGTFKSGLHAVSDSIKNVGHKTTDTVNNSVDDVTENVSNIRSLVTWARRIINHPRLFISAVIGIILLLMLATFGIGWHLRGGPAKHFEMQEKIVIVLQKTQPIDINSKVVHYRPGCETYNVARPEVVQTSMMEPSLPWSEQVCHSQTSEPIGKFIVKGASEVTVNEYAAPDAILRVDFSQPAFPGRHTPILGFGGAFTEAASLNYQQLSKDGKDAVLELLFGKVGLGYSIGRVHINSCDFSVEQYSFDDTEDDFDLADFDTKVHHDVRTGMVDMALQANSVFRDAWGIAQDTRAQDTRATSNVSNDGNLLLFASPWSPPAWMKKPTWQDDRNATHASNMTYSAQPNCLREGVGPTSRYAKSWALYFSKFITAYKKLGLDMWAVTVQNEPEFAAPWEACSYNPDTQRDFVANHLGPRLRKDHPKVKIFEFDHNRDHVNEWAETILRNSSDAAKYIDGTAYHWYTGGMDRVLDGAVGNANLHRLQDKLKKFDIEKEHIVFNSEACHCPTTGYSGGDIEIYWSRAERYSHSILADLAAGSQAWIEWNLLLDGIGGPNKLGNICESTLLSVPHRAKNAKTNYSALPKFEKSKPFGNVNVGDGRTREELDNIGFPAKYLDLGIAVQPIYYYMGHISRYVRPGSIAVMGLVDGSANPPGSSVVGRIFRRGGGDVDFVAGGGQNDLAREGIELTLWPCEGSTRQQFRWKEEDDKHFVVFGHDWLGKPTTSCIPRTVDKEYHGLRLTSCTSEEAGSFDLAAVADGDGDDNTFHFVLSGHSGHSEDDRLCLTIEELKNNGGAYGPRGGAQASLGDCSHPSAKWSYDKQTGEITSMYFVKLAKDSQDDIPTSEEVCLTTGWPFLQMGAFLTPKGDSDKTVVILNEAKDAANVILKDKESVILTSSIPPRSIQTLLV